MFKSSSIKIKSIFILVFLILSFIINNVLSFEQNERIKNILKSKAEQINLEYQVIYNSHHNMSQMVFSTQINTQKVISLFSQRKREELQNYLEANYRKLKLFSIQQIHFHLPNNDSFLRMHRPNKFGDSLTKARLTVKYVNENRKAIDGFEEGKVFNGFRFVYPMYNDKKYIGSVEVSFSALFFIKEIMKGYNVSSNFIIDKNVVKSKVFKEEISNYIKSPLDGYLYQKSVIKNLDMNRYNRISTENIRKEIIKKLKFDKPFSIYLDQYSEIATFLPLINPITKNAVAWLKINSHNKSIKRVYSLKNILLIISLTILALIMFIIYRQLIFQKYLEKKVDEKTNELNELNLHLQESIQKEIKKNHQQEEMMIAQSRHAAMGEMISMIAHQWRQPISVISMGANNILADVELDMVDIDDLKDISKEIINQTNELSFTIDDFREFFKPVKNSEVILIEEIFNSAFGVVGASLLNNDIEVIKRYNNNRKIETYSRELMQVLINILKNAKEALVENNIKNKNIIISIIEEKENIKIEIEDNAKGIPTWVIPKIFDPYFSTKNEKTGTGLGLYMSKTIVEKHLKGTIEAINKNDGACFIINLPYNLDSNKEITNLIKG